MLAADHRVSDAVFGVSTTFSPSLTAQVDHIPLTSVWIDDPIFSAFFHFLLLVH